MKERILIVDDEAKMAASISKALVRSGYTCAIATDGLRAEEIFVEQGADLVVTDRRMPGLGGIELMERLRARDNELPVILITAFGDVRSAVDAMGRGAFHYLTKPFDLDELRSVISRALEMRRLQEENRLLRQELADNRSGGLVAESPAMLAVLDLVDRAAGSDATVLIQGESGTGKERIARRVHFSSLRAGAPFVAVNCKAFARGVLESELFGHEKGAFTGADSRRLGCFERADGGTLFLDEIGDIDLDFQAKLLRVLQEGEVQPVGADAPRQFSVRVVAGTNRDLRQAMAEGIFREDLFYRLNVIPVRLPALRERPEDVHPLAHHFLERFAREGGRGLTLSPETEEVLHRHTWPGNVRELENVIERAVVLSRGSVVEVEDLLLEETQSAAAEKTAATAVQNRATLQECLDQAAADRVREALEQTSGRRLEAARQLGIDRSTLFRWMKRLDLEGP